MILIGKLLILASNKTGMSYQQYYLTLNQNLNLPDKDLDTVSENNTNNHQAGG